MMDVQSPSYESPTTSAQLPPIPVRSPVEVVENLQCLYYNERVELFRDALDVSCLDNRFDIRDLDTIMMDATRKNNAPVVIELLLHGLPLISDYVLEAAESNAKDVLENFLEKGWNINLPISQSQPPVLSFAIQDEDMTLWLLDRGANPNQRCKIDVTPLSYAVREAPTSTIELLLRRGGNVQVGQLLFHALERKTEIIKVLQLLLANGASINARMYENHYASWRLYFFMGLGTALHKATELGQTDVVCFLLQEGIDLSIKDANGRTALDCAKLLGKDEIVSVIEKDLGQRNSKYFVVSQDILL